MTAGRTTVESVRDAVQAIGRGPWSGPVTVLLAPELIDAPVADRLRDLLGRRIDQELVVAGDTDLAQVEQVADLVRPDGVVLALGGGAVMDRASLAALAADDPTLGRRLAMEQRCGFVMLPERVRRRSIGLVAVPSTLGTGAEASRTACLRIGDRKKLVHGSALRPDVAALVPEATATLPSWLVVEGALEALLRAASYFVGHPQSRPVQDPLVLQLVADIVDQGSALVEGSGSSAATRVALARLSHRTQHEELMTGLAPYSDVCWPLANELSTSTGLRKLTALALVTPAVWTRVLAGDASWGSKERLEQLWRVVRASSSTPLDARADSGLRTLIDAWRVERGAPHVETAQVAVRAAHAWGNGLPMLRGKTADQILPVYDDAVGAGSTSSVHELLRGGEKYAEVR